MIAKRSTSPAWESDMLKNIYIAGGVRTTVGSLNGSLAGLSAAKLGSIAISSAIERAGVDAGEVDEVLFGNVIGAGVGQNIARQAAIGAGPEKTGKHARG